MNKGKYWMYSKYAIDAALTNPLRKSIELLIEKKKYHYYLDFIKKQKHLKNLKLKISVKQEIITKIGSNNKYQGLALLVSPLDTNTLVKLDKNRFFEDNVIIVLDKLFDIANIGSIMRTALAFGVRNLIVLKKFFPDENSYLSSVASGALEKIQILKVSSLHKTVKLFKKSGWWIVGLESKNLSNCINIQSNKNKYNKTILILDLKRGY